MPYSELLVKPFREELTSAGFTELLSSEDVDQHMTRNNEGTTLLMINAVCGCAAGMGRPGVRMALDQSSKKPDYLVSVFAGQDLEATAKARGYFPDIPPSSPSVALFKDGELVYFIPRHRIEGRDAEQVGADLQSALEEHC